MENKTIRKIFAIIIVSILIMSCCVGFRIYTDNNSIIIDNPTSTDDMEDMFEDNEEGENEQPDSPEEVKPQVPIYSNGFKCVADAYAILDNGKGYKTVSTLSATADIFGLGKATQSATETIILSGDYYLKETYTSCTSSLGKTYYRYFYSNDGGQNVEYKKTSSYNDNIPNWDYLLEEDVLPKEEIIKYDNLAYDAFNVRAQSDNATLVKFDRTTNEKYYIISFILDVNKLPQKYIDNAIREGNLKSMTVSSLKMTYYIEKETLYLRKIERNETYTIDAGVKLNVDAYQELIVTIVDKEITPEKPAYCA